MTEQSNGGVFALLRQHPVITGVMVSCTLLGMPVAVLLMGDTWSLAQKLIGGALAGAGCGLCIVTPRIIG